MKFTVAVWGLELLCVELTWGDPTEALADLIAGLSEDSGDLKDSDEDSKEIGGGTHLHADRDDRPRYPEDRYGFEYIDRPFGFGQPVTNPSCRKKG